MSAIIISDEVANHYKGKFGSFVNENPAPTPEVVYQSLFQFGPGGEEGLFGFSMLVSRYLSLFSRPGITNWHMYFGYQDGTIHAGLVNEPNQDSMANGFRLLIKGRGEQGEQGYIETPYILLTNPLSGAASKFPDDTRNMVFTAMNTVWATIGKGNSVPTVVLIKWIEAWKNLIDTQAVDPNTLKIAYRNNDDPPTTTTSVLEGYRFSSANLLSVMNNPILSLYEEPVMRFYLVDESLGQGSQSSDAIGALGIILASFSSSSNDALPMSVSYNFSAPCPPTCPG